METAALYRRISEMEGRLSEEPYDPLLPRKLSARDLACYNLLEVTDDNGRNRVERRRNAISARENACGRFALLTTSALPWKDLMIEYRQRNEVEYDFSMLQSDLFDGVKGRSDQRSAEGGLLVNFLSLRLRLTLLKRMRASGVTDEMRVPKLMEVMRKLRITQVGGEWRLDEVTKAQGTVLARLGLPLL